MSSRFVVRPLAELDLLEAFEWYEVREPGLGADFVTAIDDVFARIAANPHLYPEVHHSVRRAVRRKFPYLVYFIASGEAVSVLGCFHSKRRPELARERLDT